MATKSMARLGVCTRCFVFPYFKQHLLLFGFPHSHGPQCQRLTLKTAHHFLRLRLFLILPLLQCVIRVFLCPNTLLSWSWCLCSNTHQNPIPQYNQPLQIYRPPKLIDTHGRTNNTIRKRNTCDVVIQPKQQLAYEFSNRIKNANVLGDANFMVSFMIDIIRKLSARGFTDNCHIVVAQHMLLLHV